MKTWLPHSTGATIVPVVKSDLESFYYSSEVSQIGETNDGITPLPMYMVSRGEIPTQCWFDFFVFYTQNVCYLQNFGLTN